MPTRPIPFDPGGSAVTLEITITGGQEANYQIAFFPEAGQRGAYLADRESSRNGESREIEVPEAPGDLDGDYLVWWIGPYGPDLSVPYRIRIDFSQGQRVVHSRSYRGTIAENPAGHLDDGHFITGPG
ncbi:MAG: hypothetical protein ACREKI_09255 [Gemmatimonadota bacterium]